MSRKITNNRIALSLLLALVTGLSMGLGACAPITPEQLAEKREKTIAALEAKGGKKMTQAELMQTLPDTTAIAARFKLYTDKNLDLRLYIPILRKNDTGRSEVKEDGLYCTVYDNYNKDKVDCKYVVKIGENKYQDVKKDGSLGYTYTREPGNPEGL